MPPKRRPLAPVLASGLLEVEAAWVAPVLAGAFALLPPLLGVVGSPVALLLPLPPMPLSAASPRSKAPFLTVMTLLLVAASP